MNFRWFTPMGINENKQKISKSVISYWTIADRVSSRKVARLTFPWQRKGNWQILRSNALGKCAMLTSGSSNDQGRPTVSKTYNTNNKRWINT